MDNGLIVSKFGGSSVKDGLAMRRCFSIVKDNQSIQLVIISATYNTTNQLEFIAHAAKKKDHEILNKVLKELQDKHDLISKDLNVHEAVKVDLAKLFEEVRVITQKIEKTEEIESKNMDQLYSVGERLSSLIFSEFLKNEITDRKVHFFDARKVIKTDSKFKKANPQINLIKELANEHLLPLIKNKGLIITQGFIGNDLFGNTTTLGREGSDYSAALFAEALEANLVQIWTDVAGVATGDPRHVTGAIFLKEMNYEEATELASHGAKVLFPRTLRPCQRKNIPVFVGSSLNPEFGGTTISNKTSNDFPIKGITLYEEEGKTFICIVGNRLDKIQSLNEKVISFFESKNYFYNLENYSTLSLIFEIEHSEKQKILDELHSNLFN